MASYIRTSLILLATIIGSAGASAQSDAADTSGALAAIQAKQNSANAPAQTPQAFPALKAEYCKQAVTYVESPSGLLGRWDSDMGKYTAYRDGILQTQNIKKELLDDARWRTSTAADLANDVHTFCNLTRDVLAAMTPEGKAINTAIDISVDFGAAVSKKAVHVYNLLEKGEAVQDALNSSIDELVVLGFNEVAKNAGHRQTGALIDILNDTASHMKTAQEAADSRTLVQERVLQLDHQINDFADKMSRARENALAVEALKDAVIAACNSGQPIETAVPAVAKGYVEPQPYSILQPQPNSTLQPSTPQQAPALPWWANLSSVRPPTAGSTSPTQAKPPYCSPGRKPGTCCPPGAKVCP